MHFHPSLPTRSLARAALATAFLGAAAGITAAPAQADSIAYVKGGDVYLATGDGSRSYRVTSTGGYSSVSQSDSGTMVAVHGNKIAYLARDGRVIADILTPVSNPSSTQTFTGPFDAQISPNGQKVSYTYYWQYIGQDPYCNPSNGCYVQRLYHGTGYTAPDRLTAWDEPGFRRQSGWIHGSWVDDDTQLLSDPYMKPNEDLVFNSPGLDKDAGLGRWAEHVQAKQMEDGEMTRDRTKMAFITGDKNERVWFYNLRTGYYPEYPSTCNTYELNNPVGGRFSDLSWSPDGSHLAFATGEGVSTVAIPAFGTAEADCGTPTEDTKVIIPGASSPDWGPADVPAGAGASGSGSSGGSGSGVGVGSAGGGGSAGVGTGTPGGQAGGGTAGGPTIGLARSGDRLRKVLKSGLRLSVVGAQPGKVTVTVRSGKLTVGTGKLTIGKSGNGKVTVRINAAGRKRLAARPKATLKITVGGATSTITIKR